MTEIWKDISGYENIYQVSNLGRIKRLGVKDSRGNLRKEKVLILPHDGRDGYLRCILCKDGVRNHVRVHRIVAEAFIPNPYDLSTVNHLDGNKQNNFVDNLEWTTDAENTRHAFKNGLAHPKRGIDNPSAKLSIEDVNYIRKNYIPNDKQYGSRALGRKFGIDHCSILNIVKYKSYQDMPNIN